MIAAAGERPWATLVLPVYNAAPFLRRTLEQCAGWMAARPEPWELIVVDDCSTDESGAIAASFAAAHAGRSIRAVRFAANRGKGFAIRVGLGLARGRRILFTDCDLAYPIENAERILSALERGADAAIACRVLRQSTYLISPSFFSYLYTRHLMGRLFNLLCRMVAVPRLLDTQAGLKGFRSEVIRPVLGRLQMSGFSFDVELLRALADRGARIVEVPVSFRYDSEPSTVRFVIDSLMMMRDLVLVRWRSARGRYTGEAPARRPARLMVTADDYGLSPGVNRAIEEGLESGAVTGASLMMGAAHSDAAIRWAAAHPWHDFGIHLNLTQGRPTLPAGEVPSLVTRDGSFPTLARFLVRYLLGRVRPEEVRAEWSAQIEAARSAGVELTHVDSHHHVHLLPGLASRVTAPLARREGLRARAMDGLPCRRWGAPDLKGSLLALASRAARRRGMEDLAPDRGVGTTLMRRPTIESLRSLLSRMEPGLSYELVVHPGKVDVALRRSGDGYIKGREAERELLASVEYRAVIQHSGVEVTEPCHKSVQPAGKTLRQTIGAS